MTRIQICPSFFSLLRLGWNLVGIWSDSYHSAWICSECVGEGKVLLLVVNQEENHRKGSVICCVFTKFSFRLHSYFDVLRTSNLFLTQLHTCLLSYYHSSCVYPFTYLSICSLFFLSTPFCFFQPPPVLLFDHSLYTSSYHFYL